MPASFEVCIVEPYDDFRLIECNLIEVAHGRTRAIDAVPFRTTTLDEFPKSDRGFVYVVASLDELRKTPRNQHIRLRFVATGVETEFSFQPRVFGYGLQNELIIPSDVRTAWLITQPSPTQRGVYLLQDYVVGDYMMSRTTRQ